MSEHFTTIYHCMVCLEVDSSHKDEVIDHIEQEHPRERVELALGITERPDHD